jgi:ribosome biogenesis GTPase / thiamine phosphate phosphatase
MTLQQLGWSPYWEAVFADHGPECLPARVAVQQRHLYTVVGEGWSAPAEVTGRFRHDAAGPADFPAVGDWVAATREGDAVQITAVLARRTQFARRMAGPKPAQQVVAANVDIAFLVTGLDHDYNLRRIERYLTLAWESGAKPVIVLNKADLREDLEAVLAEVEAIALGVPIHAVSATQGSGLEDLAGRIAPGETAALLGSSGVGKSTIVNALLGVERQAVQDVRADDSRGRHTTTHRELIPLPKGGILLDTPGMRELQVWGEGDGLDQTFEDIAARAVECRYRDCTHTNEPGCAVVAALDSGALAQARYASYQKLQREFAHLRRREDRQEQLKEKARWKQIHKEIKRHYRLRDGGDR